MYLKITFKSLLVNLIHICTTMHNLHLCIYLYNLLVLLFVYLSYVLYLIVYYGIANTSEQISTLCFNV